MRGTGGGGGSPVQRFAAALHGHGGRALAPAKQNCAVALRVLPPPSLQEFSKCMDDVRGENSSHDWSVPGAEMDAQIDCWCDHNLTHTIQEYQCCNHEEWFPMCSIDCAPDCSSELARTCIQECPSMCFEAAEYVVDKGLCARCDWTKCWPVMKCLTNHAKMRIENGTIDRTCHESDFTAGAELKNYWQCWRDAPKHSSHWNVLGSIVHCICREDMIQHTTETSCCASVLYGGGVCDLECLSEAACNTQRAQTCIHSCQRKCGAFELAPSEDCQKECLQKGAPCRKYTSCRPPAVNSHICDDGRWPEASSGCCGRNRTDGGPGILLGCPKLCDSQHIWRLDGGRAIPWWTRWQPGRGIIAQCTCKDCPSTVLEGDLKLKETVSDSLWDNGQTMLVDIARREGLLHGPNRRMQELMVMRNDEILQVLDDGESEKEASKDKARAIALINDVYAERIVHAARVHGDDGANRPGKRGGEEEMRKHYVVFAIIAGVCTCAIIGAIGVATRVVMRKKTESPITTFEQNQQVVIGNPVSPTDNAVDANGVATGAPVTVSAPTKGAREQAKELS